MDRRTALSLLAAPIAVTAFEKINVATAHAKAPEALTNTRFDHVSINVRDFEGALAWYQENLGFKVDVAWRVKALNDKRLAYLSKDGVTIELVAVEQNAAGLPEAQTFLDHFSRSGYGHLCFAVESVDAALSGLAQAGVPVFVKAETYDLDGTPFKRRVGFVKDLEGNVLEFAEPLIRAG